jgi:hypothetical protein
VYRTPDERFERLPGWRVDAGELLGERVARFLEVHPLG